MHRTDFLSDAITNNSDKSKSKSGSRFSIVLKTIMIISSMVLTEKLFYSMHLNYTYAPLFILKPIVDRDILMRHNL